MEQTPSPVDLTRLKGILGNAKKMIDIVESNSYTKGHIDDRALSEDGVMELQNEGVSRPVQTQPQHTAADYTEQDVLNSKLPPMIKEAMIKNKIPKVSLVNSTFSLNDVSDLVEKPMRFTKTPKSTQIRETYVSNNSDMITISKSELKSLIDESIMDYMTKTFIKNLNEETIKKTINLLIKEGKINVRKK